MVQQPDCCWTTPTDKSTPRARKPILGGTDDRHGLNSPNTRAKEPNHNSRREFPPHSHISTDSLCAFLKEYHSTLKEKG
ncbi:hypothetical protein BY996DRAFT_6524506, partial [Phakopsora pachyrhizi]